MQAARFAFRSCPVLIAPIAQLIANEIKRSANICPITENDNTFCHLSTYTVYTSCLYRSMTYTSIQMGF